MASNGSYSAECWANIRQEWLSGQLTVTDIGREYGPSRQAINAKARRMNWPPRGSLVDQVRKAVEVQLLEDEDVAAGVAPSEASEIVESAAKRGVTVVRRQRGLLTRLLGVADATLEEMELMTVITREILDKKRLKGKVMLLDTATRAKIDGMRAVSQVLNQAIPLERKAYSLDDEKGTGLPIRYVAPDYDKPAKAGLSEEEWDNE